LVTRADHEAEAAIREIILSEHPDHQILGEEGGSLGESSHLWLVDPLDGTVNYAHGFPFFCVSIGLDVDGVTQVGVVHDPTRGETFAAVRGAGATLNGKPVSVSDLAVLGGRTMLATGFPYDVEGGLRNLETFRRFLNLGVPVRRPGAAALDLCYVACGRLDGFWELKLQPWDCAAANLIVQEAGGRVTNGAGGPYRYREQPLVASNGLLHEALLGVIARG
ncbi:MAG TPA: inositol monophosphatase family protein, partial [Deinococcales bacterium]|nr:inositol monophosphatase family protein [Deinococcales bacterium]